MKNCLAFIVNSILGNQKTNITQQTTSLGQIVLTIEPEGKDVGKLIGKKGKIINALRKVLKVRAAKEGKKILLRIPQNLQNENGLVLAEKEAGEETKSAGKPPAAGIS